MFDELKLVYEAALDAIHGAKPAALATVIEASGSAPRGICAKMLIYADGRTVGTVGGGAVEGWVMEEARAAIEQGTAREVRYRPVEGREGSEICGGGMRIFIEPLLPRPMVLVIGAGHVGQAVAELADFLGFRIAVLDERRELLTPERFPRAARLLAGDPAEQVTTFDLDENTYLVIVTPHQSMDERILAAVADGRVAYVGMLGGRRRSAHTFERARETGVPDGLLNRVSTPIGLDIGAETPREIAVSVMSEIIAVQRAHAAGEAEPAA